MKSTLTALILTLSVLVPGASAEDAPAAKPNTLTETEKAAGWQLLFNGSDLKGWSNFKVCPPTVTVFSCIASSNEACVFGGVRLISSDKSIWVKIGPF